MYCSKCGANVADGIAFCSACGKPMVGFSVGKTTAATPSVDPVAPGGTVYAPPAQAYSQPLAARPVAYAGFWLRFVALIIDQLLLYFVVMILLLPFAASVGMGMRGMATGRPPDLQALLPMIHVMFRLALLRIIVHWLYYSLLESSAWQGTLGKKSAGAGSHGPGWEPHQLRPRHRPFLREIHLLDHSRYRFHYGGIHGEETSAARYSGWRAGHPQIVGTYGSASA